MASLDKGAEPSPEKRGVIGDWPPPGGSSSVPLVDYKSPATGELIGGADVIPDVGGHQREAMILGENYDEAVGQSVFLKLDVWRSD